LRHRSAEVVALTLAEGQEVFGHPHAYDVYTGVIAA